MNDHQDKSVVYVSIGRSFVTVRLQLGNDFNSNATIESPVKINKTNTPRAPYNVSYLLRYNSSNDFYSVHKFWISKATTY